MTIDELRKELSSLATDIESQVQGVVSAATKSQELIYAYLIEQISRFDAANGIIIYNDNAKARLLRMQNKMYSIIQQEFNPSLKPYLKYFDDIDNRVYDMHLGFNQIKVSGAIYNETRAAVYNQTKQFLTTSVAEAYVLPATSLVNQMATRDMTYKQAYSLVKNWNEGELPAGKLPSARPTPRLQAYAGQIARDSMFQYSGVLQDKVAEKHELTKFIYVGGVIQDSRPLCRHLVGLKRKIDISEIPKLLIQYPEGTFKDTTKANFYVYRGGYNCRHQCMPVK